VHILKTFKGVSNEDKDELSEELKKKFQEALKGKLKTRECEGCPLFSKAVIDFLIDQLVEAINRMDKASQTMEEFIALFCEIEESEFKARMRGGDDRL